MPNDKGERTPVVPITRIQVLIGYHNSHLKTAMANIVNLHLYAGMKDADVVETQPVHVPGPDGRPMVTNRTINVKQARASELGTLREHLNLISIIEAELAGHKYDMPDGFESSSYLASMLTKFTPANGAVPGKAA